MGQTHVEVEPAVNERASLMQKSLMESTRSTRCIFGKRKLCNLVASVPMLVPQEYASPKGARNSSF